MPTVHFLREDEEIDVEEGANLRDAARQAGISMHSMHGKVLNCFGNGLCGTCGILVKNGMENLSPRGLVEKGRLLFSLFALGQEDEARLSCQVTVHGDVEIVTKPGVNLFGDAKTFYDYRVENDALLEFPDDAPRQYWDKQPTVPIRFDQEREKFLKEREEEKQETSSEGDETEGEEE